MQRIVKGSNSSAATTTGTLNEAIVQMEQEPSAVYFLAEDKQVLQQPFIYIRLPKHYACVYPMLFSDFN